MNWEQKYKDLEGKEIPDATLRKACATSMILEDPEDKRGDKKADDGLLAFRIMQAGEKDKFSVAEIERIKYKVKIYQGPLIVAQTFEMLK